MKIHTETRSKKIITQFYDLGLSVSYDRVLQLESQLTTAVSENFQEKVAVVPAQLRYSVFTIGALDNIDHNPSSTIRFMVQVVCFSPPLHWGWERSRMTSDFLWLTASLLCQVLKVSVPQLSNVLVDAFLKEKSWLKHASQRLQLDFLNPGRIP